MKKFIVCMLVAFSLFASSPVVVVLAGCDEPECHDPISSPEDKLPEDRDD